MPSRQISISLAVLLIICLALSIIFQSDDHGVRGIIADISFFGFLFLLLFFVVMGVILLFRYFRHKGESRSI